ncbi:hypothetical protein MES5069_400143 [Mesorhizobium escarrei]|uniref:Uncharacterized protein n=1 Tax=Mesorhizobium escarrei TaxID=666018 RepID=A0ABM9E5Z9_9HYPH|nr:hypothetical protein MES5069_400143 [Mesorhizobium escarrei]
MRLEKKDFPLIRVREHLETGPIVLMASHHKGYSNNHDDGLAHDDAVLASAAWLLHLGRHRSHSAIGESRDA